jgi:hypothetical protein
MLVFFWIALSFVVGAFARSKGHSFFAGLLFALLLSPIIAGLVVAIRKPNTEELERRALGGGAVRKCPACAELVKADAVKCKHCGADLPPVEKPVDPW